MIVGQMRCLSKRSKDNIAILGIAALRHCDIGEKFLAL